jgi:hypothetical protein
MYIPIEGTSTQPKAKLRGVGGATKFSARC